MIRSGPAFRVMLLWEVRYLLRQRTTILSLLAYAILAWLVMIVIGSKGLGWLTGSVSVAGTGDTVFINAPVKLLGLMQFFVFVAMPAVAAFATSTGCRDYETGMYQLFYTTPITKAQYLGARFTGVMIVCVLLGVMISTGLALGAATHFPEPNTSAPFSLMAYAMPLFGFFFPSVFLSATIFFGIAITTRRAFTVYLSVVVLLVLYLTTLSLSNSFEYRVLAALIDPFGIRALNQITEYWSMAERLTQFVYPSGILLANRILWLVVTFGIGIVAFWQFRFSYLPRELFRTAKRRTSTFGRTSDVHTFSLSTESILGTQRFPGMTHWRKTWLIQLLTLIRWWIRQLVRSWSFVIVLLLSTILMIAIQKSVEIYDTTTYPVTYQMIEMMVEITTPVVLVLIAIYAGELVWSERAARMDQIIDSAPVPTWVLFLGKLFALIAIIALLHCYFALFGIGSQAANGYYRFELDQYAVSLIFLGTLRTLLFAIICLGIQIAVQHRSAGYVVTGLVYVGLYGLSSLTNLHPLFLWNSGRDFLYSDMNGYAPFLGRLVSANIYWTAISILIAVIALLFWQRGNEITLRMRYHVAKRRISRPWQIVTLMTALVVVGSGSYIYYETDVRHTSYSARKQRHLFAEYERRYKRYQRVAQPRITAVRLSVDIFPEVRRLRAGGTLTLRNTTAQTIDTIHIELPIQHVQLLAFSRPVTSVLADTIQRHYMYHLGTPLTPGDSMTITFDLVMDRRGFTRSGPFLDVVQNGTFVNSREFLPSIGYDPYRELSNLAQRKRENLRERVILPVTDPYVHNQSVARDADFIDFEATVSTSDDQIAIAPGYLQREWKRDGRRYFHYKMDAPILHFFSVQSGRYSVLRDRWRDVVIEIYYHPTHSYNLSKMVAAIKAGLEYYSTNFGPYQHRQVRVIEFPRYGSFAQAFPNTIPFSEAVGFIARVEKNDIDYPFYVTAHEVAHQWWAHQVVAANGPGSMFLEETMSEYSALMVMEQQYGRHQIARLLQYERHKYLSERSQSTKEQPLSTIREGMDAYTKGGLAMYALRGYLGEEKLNSALKDFVTNRRFQGPPYTTAADLITALRKTAPDSLQPIITDLFERITFYDLRVIKAMTTRQSNGQYQVTIQFKAKKMYADSTGRERSVPMREWMDIGVYGDSSSTDDRKGEVPITVRLVQVITDLNTVTFVVDQRPTRIVLDPFVKLMTNSIEHNEAPIVEQTR